MRYTRTILTSSTNTLKFAIFVAALVTAILAPMFSNPITTHADASCSPNGISLSGSSWLNDGGVNVCNNGSSPYDDYGADCVPLAGAPGQTKCSNNAGQVYAGEQWQCVDLVNRLYLAKSWTTTTWWGNGDTLINSVPSTLTEQANGSISYLNPGDVITLTDKTTGTSTDDGGHAGIINSISGNTIYIINQNADLNSSAYIQSGSFSSGNVTLHMNAWAPYNIQAVVHHPFAPPEVNYLYYRGGTTIEAKAGLNDPWQTMYSTAADMKAVGTRMAFIDSNTGDVWAKDTLGGALYDEYGAVNQYVVTPSYLIIRTGSTVLGKAGLNDPWTTLWTGATDVQAAGTRIVIVDGSGNVWAKDTLGGAWYEESSAVNQYVVTPNYLIIRSGTTVQAKAGLNDPWQTMYSTAADMQAVDTRMAFRDSGTGDIWAKDTLGGTLYDESAPVDQYAVTYDYIAVRSGTTVQAKAGLNDPWQTMYSTASDMQLAGIRMAFVDSNTGNIIAKDTLGGTLYDESAPVDQYAVTTTY